MNDDPMNSRTAGGQELARRLEAYAEARLSPDPAAVARIRARVMLEARTRLEAPAALAQEPQPIPIGWARSVRRLRRPVAVLLAAGLSLSALGGVAFAAQAGGPLYDARLWVEAATLPTDPAARSAADVSRLEARLGEVMRASRDGNEHAADAALVAYEAVVDDALRTAGTDDDLLAHLEEVLGKHLTVLNALLDKVPEQARFGIENAIEKSGKALEKAGGQGSQGGGNQGGGNQGGGNQGGGNPGGGNPAHTPKPLPDAAPKGPPGNTQPTPPNQGPPERTPPAGPPDSHPGKP
jgi:uncharacterized membrane protein YgcG